MVILYSKVPYRKQLMAAMFKVLSQQLRGTLTTAFERHVTIEDFTDMNQHRCQVCTKTFVSLLYAPLKQAQFLA